MENPEEILHSLEEFSKMKPKDIPRELEEYLKFVAKTGDPVYQWGTIKSLFREKLLNVITEFYESCTSMEIPPCPNVDMFNYDLMKNFIIERLDTFVAAPFTLQRLCELLTSPKKEYTRIDKYMRALEKNILVVSTTEPGGRRTENGEGIVNGIESDHEPIPEPSNEINVEEMDEPPYVQSTNHLPFKKTKTRTQPEAQVESSVDTYLIQKFDSSEASTSNQEVTGEVLCVHYVSIEPVTENSVSNEEDEKNKDTVSVTITAINVKQESNVVEQPIIEQGSTSEASAADFSDVAMENNEDTENKPSILTTDTSISTNPIQPTDGTIDTETPEIPTSTTAAEKFSEASDPEAFATKTDNENLSPENSITSSESSCESNSVIPTELIAKFEAERLETADGEQVQEKVAGMASETAEEDSSDGVDSTTQASGDTNIELTVDSKEVDLEDKEAVPEPVEKPVINDNILEEKSISETAAVAEADTGKIEEPSESIVHPEETTEEAPSVELKIDETSDLSAKVETPMEVDIVSESAPEEKVNSPKEESGESSSSTETA